MKYGISILLTDNTKVYLSCTEVCVTFSQVIIYFDAPELVTYCHSCRCGRLLPTRSASAPTDFLQMMRDQPWGYWLARSGSSQV